MNANNNIVTGVLVTVGDLARVVSLYFYKSAFVARGMQSDFDSSQLCWQTYFDFQWPSQYLICTLLLSLS